VASVAALEDKLKVLGCQVVIISFGHKEGALSWKNDTACTFPIFLDPTRSLYTHFQMKRSLAKVWSRDTCVYYVEQFVLRSKEKVKPYPNDDPLQMGGDVLINSKEGTVTHKHISSSPADRPELRTMLDIMKKKC